MRGGFLCSAIRQQAPEPPKQGAAMAKAEPSLLRNCSLSPSPLPGREDGREAEEG